MKKGCPTFAVIVLALALMWLFTEMEIIILDIPWFPLILVIIAVGWIVNHYR